MTAGDISMRKFLTIEVSWDEEAKVWVAESEDISGLVTEAATMEELQKKLDIMIPEMLEANSNFYQFDQNNKIPYRLLSDHIITNKNA
jgi:predicted RNase H-like HicB family nuclease